MATYSLAAIKAAVVKRGVSAFTKSAIEGAFAMGLTSTEMLDAVAGTASTHFYKTMPADKNPGVWQDVYRVPTPAGMAYMKYTLAAGNPRIVISFKEL